MRAYRTHTTCGLRLAFILELQRDTLSMNNEQSKLDETIVISYLSIGVACFLSILGLIFCSQYFGWKVEWIFFRIAWMFFFTCGIVYLLYNIYKLDGYTGTSVERNEIFFTFFDIPTIVDKDKLIINFTKKDLFLCVEKFSTAISVLSISFIVFKFQPRFGIIYIINFISACLIPFVSSFFFFHVVLKISLSMILFFMKVKEINYSDYAKDKSDDTDETKDAANKKQENAYGRLKIILGGFKMLLIRFKMIEKDLQDYLKIFIISLVICSLLFTTFGIVGKLMP